MKRRSGAAWGGGVGDWWFCYYYLLKRCFWNTWRNPGNLLARALCNAFVSLVAGMIFFQVAKKRQHQADDFFYGLQILTCCNMTIFGTSVTPFAAMSIFINDREFFLSDSASGLYPISAYFLAQMTVELVVAAINAFMYSIIALNMTGILVLFPDPIVKATRAVEIIGIIVLASLVGASMVQFFAVLAPNFDIAFVLNSSNACFALLTGGMIVFYPAMTSVSSWMKNISFLRFLFQALAQKLLVGSKYEFLLDQLWFRTPPTVAHNLLIASVFYFSSSLGTYLCLRFLSKEKR